MVTTQNPAEEWVVVDGPAENTPNPPLPKPNFPGAPAHIINQPGVQQTALNVTDLALARDRDQLLREDVIMRMWLDGKPMAVIIQETGLAWATIKSYIQKGRGILKEILADDVNNLAAERVEGFRDIKCRALGFLDLQPKNAPQLLKIVMDAEVNMGKIQGVLNERVVHLGTIKHEHTKMYDFVDALPDAPEAADGQYRELPAPTPQSPAQESSPIADWHKSSYAAVPSTSDLTRNQRAAAQRAKEVTEILEDGFPEGVEFIIG